MPRNSLAKLDTKDHKILSLLQLDGRASTSDIAREAGLSKQLASYRINSLIHSGVITRFVTVINPHRLGYFSYNVLLQLQFLSSEQEQALVQGFLQMPEVGWAVSTMGKWNLVISTLVETPKAFSHFLDKMYAKFGRSIRASQYYIVTEAFPGKWKGADKIISESYRFGPSWETPQLKEVDKLILQTLAREPRATIVDLSRVTGARPETIRNRLDLLHRQQILLGSTAKVDPKAMGFEWYLLLFELEFGDPSERKRFIETMITHPQVVFIVESLGSWNVVVDVNVLNGADLKKLIESFYSEFSRIIKGYEPLLIHKEHKCRYIPEKLFVSES